MPNLPTDNLYKFLTTLGVVIFLFSFWTINESVKIATLNANTYKAASELLTDEEEYLTEMVSSLETEIDQLASRAKDAQNNKSLTDVEIEKLSSDLAVIIKTKDLALKKREEILTRRKIINEKYTEVTAQLKDASGTIETYRMGYFGGMLMAITGFLLWYHRHQKYQDMIVKQQALSAIEQTKSSV